MHAAWLETVRTLLAVRSAHIVPGLDGMAPTAAVERHGERGFTIAWRLANDRTLVLQANLGDAPMSGFGAPEGVIWATDGTDASSTERPGWSVVAALGPG